MSTNTFLRTQISKLEKQMLELAEKVVSAPLGQVDYLVAVGKYRGFKSTRDQYVDLLRRETEDPSESDDESESESESDIRPRRDYALPAPGNPVRKPPRPRSWGGR